MKCLAEVCEKTGWGVHAWVLMDNHYHLFIQTPDASLVKGRKWFQNTVTRRFIVRHREWGRLFGDRYKAVVVEGESPYYYETLWDYIHLNPGRSGLAEGGAEIADFCGVEFGAYGFKGGAWGQGALPGGQAGCLDVGAINPAYSIGFSSDIIEPAGRPLSRLHRASANARIPPATTSKARAAKKWPIGQKNDGPDRVEVFLRRRGLFIESTALNHFFWAV